MRELKRWRSTENRSINNVQVIVNPIEDLNIKVSGGFDYLHLRDDQYNPGGLSITTDLGSANRYANYVLNWNTSATAATLSAAGRSPRRAAAEMVSG